MVAEGVPPPVLLGQSLLLEQDADRPVEDHDPLLEQPIESFASRGGSRGGGGHGDPQEYRGTVRFSPRSGSRPGKGRRRKATAGRWGRGCRWPPAARRD